MMIENENNVKEEERTDFPKTSPEPAPATRRRHRGGVPIFRNALFCLTPLLLYLLISSGLSSLTAFYFPDSLPGRDLASMTALCDAVILPVMIILYRRDAEKGVRPMAVRPKESGKRLLLYALIFLAGMALSVFSSFLMELFHMERFFSNAAQETLLSAPPAVQVIALGILAPAAEEMVFRGLFYSRTRFYLNRYTAALVSALIFAAGHGNVIQMLYAFPMGLILVLVYEKTGSIAGPVVCHMGANMISVLINLLAA